MSGALLFLVVGLLLILLLILSVWRTNEEGHARLGSFEDDSFPAVHHAEPLPQELAARLFGPQDQEFIAKQGCTGLKRLFRQQRTELALCWLRAVRTNATDLIRVHSQAARKSSGLVPLVESKVVLEYFGIQMICRFLALVIWLRGPVDLSRLVGYMDDLSMGLYEGATGLFSVQLKTESYKRGTYLTRSRRGG